MTWQAVARKDFQDAVRSKWLWVLSAIFVGLFVGGAYFLGSRLPEEAQQQVTTNQFFQSVVGQLLITLIVPLVAIVISYSAIVGERESGSLKLLLSLPHSRLDAVVGKTVGRSGVVALPILLGLLLAAVVLGIYGVGIDVIDFLVFGILTTLLGVVFVSTAVGISAAASTNRRAMLGSVGLFFVFTFLWNRVRQILSLVNDQLSLNLELMELVKYGLFIKFFNPVRAYQTLAARLYSDTQLQARLYDSGMLGQMIQQQMDGLPFYLSDTVVMAQFLLWLFVPLALGYLVFDDADL
jgi:ABC-2 type transport system permease protein